MQKDNNVHNFITIFCFQAPIEKELEFPCEKTTIYDTYNPFHVNKSLSPPTAKGNKASKHNICLSKGIFPVGRQAISQALIDHKIILTNVLRFHQPCSYYA